MVMMIQINWIKNKKLPASIVQYLSGILFQDIIQFTHCEFTEGTLGASSDILPLNNLGLGLGEDQAWHQQAADARLGFQRQSCRHQLRNNLPLVFGCAHTQFCAEFL